MNPEDWKAKLGAAFNVEVPTANAENDTEDTQPAGDALQQQGKGMVDIMLDKRNRNGKKVTLLTGFTCDEEALKELARELKQHCGVGGSARGGEILIQGDFRQKLLGLMKDKGFKARVI